MIDKSEYTEWLLSMISNRQSYHNQKETMAWVVTALYVPSIIYLGYIEGRIWRNGWEALVTVLIVLASYFVFVFVKMQFDNRWQAADVIKVLLHRWSEFIRKEEIPTNDKWMIDENSCGEKYDWPRFVQTKVNDLEKKNRNWEKALEALMWICTLWYGLKNTNKFEDRWKTEIPSYLLVIVSTLAAIYLAVWN